MPHIFISYAKKDTRDLAIALHDALNTLDGVTAWVDKTMRAGRSWELQIETEIDKCDFMIVLYSDDLHRHKRGEPESYVLTEIAYAKYTAKKPIIPVMARPTTAPMSLTMEHYIDFIGQGMTIEALVEALCYEMNITPAPKTGNTSTATSAPVRTTFLSSESPPSPKIIIPKKPKIILPQPFDWCYIPAGKVTLTHTGGYLKEPTTLDIDPFWMSKYPITNAHYGEYVKEGGSKPKYWDDAKWNGANHPVVGVSWHDAMAFCAWLSKKMDIRVILPTEQEWQRAAQGDDGREYPWGNEFDKNRCNTSESGIGQTTPVTQYEGKGDSPFGVVDMSGNVWHWCLTGYNTGSNNSIQSQWRILRGGSLNDDSDRARVSYRFNPFSISGKFSIGFFVVSLNY